MVKSIVMIYMVNEDVDFLENKHKIKRKSIYYSKYHVKNLIDEITSKNNIKLAYEIRMKINRTFHLTSKVSPQVNENRKRNIPINYIL